MSTVQPKGHRHTRSTAVPGTGVLPLSQNPQNPHHLNSQAYNLNSQTSQSDMESSPQPSTPPQTPRRKDHNQPHKATPNAPETGSKKKTRNQRPKNVNTSPALARNGRPSPPLAGAQSAGLPSKPIATPSTTAYAGPTFHASPAPSALPIPSFYSKSVPDSPGFKALKHMKDAPLSPKPLTNGTLQHESPLDLFFKADREEKARAKSASSTQMAVAATGPFQPPSDFPQTSQTPPISSNQNKVRHGSNRMSSGGIFAMELDGESSPGAPFGPAFSTPYSERISAARAASSPGPSRDINQNSSSEALKAYLFSGHQLPSPITPSSNGNSSPSTPTTGTTFRTALAPNGPRNSASRTQSYGTSVRSSGLRQEVTPTKTPDRTINYSNSPTPARRYGNSGTSEYGNMEKHTNQATSPPVSSFGVTSGTRSADIQGMEDSLRRILKLDPAGSPGPVSGNLLAATASVPNYVGGRPPPMNGVMGS